LFCNQCEQTPVGGCTVVGVCGKDETISSLQDTIIYGLKGIAAYRTHANQLGYTDSFDIPRYIDLGQCNNSGSTVKIAMAIAEAFGCEINELPVSIVLSWFEQKAVAILLGLFSLGIQDIRIGPKAPDFISEGVLKVLQDTFNLKLIGTAQEDMADMLQFSEV